MNSLPSFLKRVSAKRAMPSRVITATVQRRRVTSAMTIIAIASNARVRNGTLRNPLASSRIAAMIHSTTPMRSILLTAMAVTVSFSLAVSAGARAADPGQAENGEVQEDDENRERAPVP